MDNAMAGRNTKKSVFEVLGIGLRLLAVCVVVAAVVALVNEVTRDRYARIQQEEKQSAMATIFGVADIAYRDLGGEVYEIMQGDTLLGYCVESTGAGFGGDLSLMVGFHSDRSVRGVQILSHSETPGVGAKVDDPAYLSQYAGVSGDLTLGEEIDAISGATISSRAVLSGVKSAQEALENALTGGTEP